MDRNNELDGRDEINGRDGRGPIDGPGEPEGIDARGAVDAPYRAPIAAPMGSLVREHRWGLTPFLIGLAIFFIAPAALIPLAMREDMTKWEPMAWIGLLIGGLGMPIGGIAILVSARRLARNYVRLRENGFEYKWGKIEATVPWDDVVSIKSKVEQKFTNGIPGPVTHQHHIKTKTGRTLSITQGYRDVAELIAEMKRRTFSLIAKRAQERFDAGHEVAFGALRVSRERGILASNGALGWNEVHDVKVAEGVVTILRSGGAKGRSWERENLSAIENSEVFLALVDRAREPAKTA